jgi:signal transduction histidine kinase
MAMSRRDDWQRWKSAWQHTFFGFWLLLSTAGALSAGPRSLSAIAVPLALVAGLVGWYGCWFVVRQAPDYRIYLAGAAILWIVLAVVDPRFLLVGSSALIPICTMRPIWAAVAVGLGEGIWLWERMSARSGLSWVEVTVLVLSAVLAVGIAGFLAVLDREGRRRHSLLDDLSAAQVEIAASERRAGTLAERQRLARDIHDTLTQGFASIAMLLDAAEAMLDDDAPARDCVQRARRTARENLAESRRLVWALRPLPLDGALLPDAVAQLGRRLTEEAGVRARTVTTGELRALSGPVETAILRVVQEALTNAGKHAEASEVTVTVSYMDDMTVVDVQDDGVGFHVGGVGRTGGGSGMGLSAMRERVTEVGGSLTVESSPGQGTTIVVAVPSESGRAPAA